MKPVAPLNPILVIDDEAPIVALLTMALKDAGFGNVVGFTDSRQALDAIRTQVMDLALIDLNMPHLSGGKMLEELGKWQPGVPVIVITGQQDVESAVACLKQGAYEYLVKPFEVDRLIAIVRNALKLRELQRENTILSCGLFEMELRKPEVFAELVTRNAAMKAVFRYVEAIAETGHPVLITGETGTGKELLAKAVHKASGRTGRFVAVNVAGLDDALFSDTLFGHRKGAFTGADTARAGLVASAAGGTLFLDEVGDLATASQVKLLRLLQEHEYLPLGTDNPESTDARVVVATNVDLARRLEVGQFRADLFYRLNTHKIELLPLRKRHDDLALLVDHFLERAVKGTGKKKPAVPKELVPLLAEYDFPGNVRELEALVTDVVSQHQSHTLSLQGFKVYLNARLQPAIPDGAGPAKSCFSGKPLPLFNQVKKLLVAEALRRTGGNMTRAAELLGTTRQSLMWQAKKSAIKESRGTEELGAWSTER